MPIVDARRPFERPRFETYRSVAAQIRAIFGEYTEHYKPMSLDEAYLDVTSASQWRDSGTLITKDIKAKIFRQTGLTALAVISLNKFLAKIASDVDKPDGLYMITPDMAGSFIARMPVVACRESKSNGTEITFQQDIEEKYAILLY
jgi:DNA polymerase-4